MSRRLRQSQPAAAVLTVDWRLCAGAGVCAAALGELIGRDDWGFPTGLERSSLVVPGDLVPAARTAVATCPMAALRLSRAPRV